MFSLPDVNLLQLFALKQNEFGFMENPIEQSLIGDSNFITDEEIVECINKKYFNIDNGFDIIRFELDKVPVLCTSEDIIKLCKHLTKQHHIISKKLLLLILQKHIEYKVELNEILKIKRNIINTLKECQICRQDLILPTQQFTTLSLRILFYLKKKKILRILLKILCTIKTLCHTKYQLKQYIDEENYQKVIFLISKYHEGAGINKKYDCIAALHNNLKDTLDQIEENLDISLSKICSNFDFEKYSAIQSAYNFLGKSQIAINQLHMHFMAAINNATFNAVNKYTDVNSPKEYRCLSKTVSLANFMFCLIDICKSQLRILESYYKILKWHENYKRPKSTESKEDHLIYNKKYILQKLQIGIEKICNDIESKIIIYLDSFNLMSLKFEEFLQVVNIIDRIFKIEKKTCKNHESKLHEYIKEKFINYFKNYHISRIEELKIFLENESWKLCPVKPTFKISELQEFRTFKYISNTHNATNIHESTCDTSDYKGNHADNIYDTMFSFDIISYAASEEDILQDSENVAVEDSTEDSDDEIPEELKLDYVDEINTDRVYTKKKCYTGPVITNTSLSLLRTSGKYLQVTRYFYDFNKTVAKYIAQIFEIYFHTVYTFFTTDHQICDTLLSTNIKRTISRIKDGLFIDFKTDTEDTHETKKIHFPSISASIDLNDSKTLFGLAERIVAIESLIFLGKQYESFQSYLYSVTFGNEENSQLSFFYSNTVSLSILLRKPIYMATISKFFNATNTINLMNKVNWELNEVVSQHNTYIDVLIKELFEFEEMLKDVQNFVSINKEVYESIWENVAHFITHVIVEGFSNVKKCTNAGRALMQLDFTQFILKYEKITSIRPMPYQDYVTTYIKAYYLPESNLESWIKNHSEYTSKHLNGLISSMYQNKKIRHKFGGSIEDQRYNK